MKKLLTSALCLLTSALCLPSPVSAQITINSLPETTSPAPSAVVPLGSKQKTKLTSMARSLTADTDLGNVTGAFSLALDSSSVLTFIGSAATLTITGGTPSVGDWVSFTAVVPASFTLNFPSSYRLATAGAAAPITSLTLAAGVYDFTFTRSAYSGGAWLLRDSFDDSLAAPAATPGPPSGLVVTPSNAQNALNWTASSPLNGPTTYNVYRGSSAGGEGGTPIVSGLTSTSYTNTGLTNGTAYFYKTAGVNSAGTSVFSNEASGTPSGGGIVYLVNENCEGTGTPTGWTDNGNLATGGSWDDTTSPLQGAQSLYMATVFSGTYATFTPQTTVYAKCQMRIDFAASSLDHRVAFRDSGGNVLVSLQSATPVSTSQTVIYANGAASSPSATSLTSGTNYYVWLKFVSGGTCEVAISATNTKPTSDGSGNVFLTATAASGSASQIALGNHDAHVHFDMMQVSASSIP